MKKILFLIALFGLSITSVMAQITIHGMVKSAIDGKTLPGAAVVIKGTTRGTTTDMNGNYTLTNVSKSATLVFSFIGMQTKEIPVGNKTVINVTLTESLTSLKQVVVTALGISRQKRSLGYSVQEVKSSVLNQTGDTKVTNALLGKVAGVSINSSGTGVGGSVNVTIRGNSSLSGNNSPLWIVDGVPFSNNQVTGNNQWGNIDMGGGIADLNPQDIKSISVLKGPAAAALYGTRAGNGVIIVTLKKGKRGKKSLGISYNFTDTYSVPAYFLNMQNKYGQGSGGAIGDNISTNTPSSFAGAWGPAMSGQQIVAWYDNSKTIPYVAHPNNLKDFFNTGNIQSHNVSVSGGGENGSFRATFNHVGNKGMLPTNSLYKNSINLVSNYQINKFLKVDAEVNYVRSSVNNQPHLGFYDIMSYLYMMPSNIDIRNIDKYKLNPTALSIGKYIEQYYVNPSANNRNPYAQTKEYQNNDTRNHFFGFLSANIKFSKAFNLELRSGMDYYNSRLTQTFLWNDIVYPGANPSINITYTEFKEQNSDFLFNFNKNLTNFSIKASVGGNLMSHVQRSLYGGSGQLAVQGAYYLDLGTNKNTYNTLYQKDINSLYGFVDLGYKNYLYLDLTARNDWSSTLPPQNRSFFYPSASLSAVVTQMMDDAGANYNKDVFSYIKLRGSVAQVGKDTDPYQLANVYSTGRTDFGLVQATPPSTLANNNLKPEIKTSYSFGTDLKFFMNRLGIDFTYYNNKTKNQILEIPQVQSSGYQFAYKNAGLITNHGMEFTVSGTPVRTKNFNLDLGLNLSTNRTLVNRLDPAVKMYIFGTLNNGLQVVAIEGHKLGDIYGTAYELNSDGSKLIGSDGLPVSTSNNEVIGNIQPNYKGSFSVNANYKGLYCSALFTFQNGGDIYSYTQAIAASAGTAAVTGNRKDMVIKGEHADGSQNTTAISAQKYWQSNLPDQRFIYSASFLKLKELAIGYNFSKKLLQRIPYQPIKNLKLSFVTDNLAYLIKHTPGTTPDGSAMSANIFSQAIDFSGLPGAQTFGFSLNVGF